MYASSSSPLCRQMGAGGGKGRGKGSYGQSSHLEPLASGYEQKNDRVTYPVREITPFIPARDKPPVPYIRPIQYLRQQCTQLGMTDWREFDMMAMGQVDEGGLTTKSFFEQPAKMKNVTKKVVANLGGARPTSILDGTYLDMPPELQEKAKKGKPKTSDEPGHLTSSSEDEEDKSQDGASIEASSEEDDGEDYKIGYDYEDGDNVVESD